MYEKIKKICEKQGMSITKLEQLAGLSNGTIGKWKKSSPSVRNLSDVAKVLGVNVSELIENTP